MKRKKKWREFVRERDKVMGSAGRERCHRNECTRGERCEERQAARHGVERKRGMLGMEHAAGSHF